MALIIDIAPYLAKRRFKSLVQEKRNPIREAVDALEGLGLLMKPDHPLFDDYNIRPS